MADGKQQPQSNETAKGAAAQSAKREGLLAKAKERIDRVDVANDNKHDAKETEVKKKALDFVSNECLTLPEDRFFKLIDAIEIRMKQREAYKENLLEEFRKARKEIADSIAVDGKQPIRENSAVSIESAYVPKKLATDNGPTLLKYLTTAISNNFDPAKFNPGYDMPLFEAFEKYPELEGQFYKHLMKYEDALAGFLVYWKPWHPVLKALENKGMGRAISRITKIEAQLRKEFWITRETHLWGGDPKEQMKLVKARVVGWRTGDSYNKTLNAAGDMLGVDRKIFTNKFASNPAWMPEATYTQYVKRSANYLEYAVAAGASGKKEFMEQIDSSTEVATGFIMDWNENNQIYQALKLRGKENVAVEISRWKNEAMKLYGIQVGTNTENNRSKVTNLVRFALNRTDEEKASDRNLAAKDAFSNGKEANVIRSARYLNYATAYGNEKEWASFVAVLKSDRKQFAQFITNWNENSPLWAEIKRNNGSTALERLNALLLQTKRDYSMPATFGNVTKEAAVLKVEEYLKMGENTAKERTETREKIDSMYSDHRKYVGVLFNRIKEGVLEQDRKKVEKAKRLLTEFSDKTLAPLQTEAAKLPGDFVNGVEMMNPTFKKVASLRVAIEAMNTMSVSDTGEVISALKWTALSDANKTWIQAKEWQINAILDQKDLGAVVGFTSEYGWIQRTQLMKTQAMFDEEIRTKKIGDVNAEAFYQTVCQANVLWTLNLHDLKGRWGEYQLLKIALHWGVVEHGNIDLGNNSSLAFKKLQNDRPNVAGKFLGVLKQAVKEREAALGKIDMENADLKSVKDCLKGMKPHITDKEAEAILTEMKTSAPSKRLIILERLKWDGELSEKEIANFFSSLEKVKGNEIAKTKKEMAETGIADVEIQHHPDITTLFAKASDAYAKNKTKEDYELITLLTRSDFNYVTRAEDPKGTTPRPRKFSEIRKNDVAKIAAAAAKHLPEGSKLREYFKLNFNKTQLTREQAEAGVQAASAKAWADLVKAMGKLPPAAAKKMADTHDSASRKVVEVIVIKKDREDTRMTAAPLTKEEKKAVVEAAKAVENASEMGYGILPGESSGITKESLKSGNVFRDYLNDVAAGKIQLSEEQSELWAKAKENVPKVSSTSAKDSADRSDYAHSIPAGKSPSDAFAESKPGETMRIGNALTAVKTEGGGLEIVTGTRKLRFSPAEAEGAVQQIDLLKEAWAEFLIPAMKEIAVASETRIKDGVGREESARILSVLSRAFGYDSVTKETDPKLMLEKFKNASSWASGDGGIGAKARSLGILDPTNNSLKSEVLVRMMGGAPETETKAETPIKA